MMKIFRTQVVLAVVVVVAGAVCFAQSGGEAVYKAKCAMCHGATGTPNPAMAKSMGIKPAGDADMKKLTVDQIVAVVKGGKGKMKAIAGISDADAKASAAFYHGLK